MVLFVSREVTIPLSGSILLLVMKRKGSLVLSLAVPLRHLPNNRLVNVVSEGEIYRQ
jgi:hypothetical protein